MTTTEINALSDAELVRLVAEKVMGWKSRSLVVKFDWEQTNGSWCPLDDWNATMMVVAAMRVKGWEWTLELDDGLFQAFFFKDTELYFFAETTERDIEANGGIVQRRAVLRAALTAVGN